MKIGDEVYVIFESVVYKAIIKSEFRKTTGARYGKNNNLQCSVTAFKSLQLHTIQDGWSPYTNTFVCLKTRIFETKEEAFLELTKLWQARLAHLNCQVNSAKDQVTRATLSAKLIDETYQSALNFDISNALADNEHYISPFTGEKV